MLFVQDYNCDIWRFGLFHFPLQIDTDLIESIKIPFKNEALFTLYIVIGVV